MVDGGWWMRDGGGWPYQPDSYIIGYHPVYDKKNRNVFDMPVDIEPIIDTPALRLRLGDEVVIIIADLHLGVEHAIADAGMQIPRRTWEIQEKMIDLCKKNEADRLFILGDIKHSVPGTSWQETQELPEFFRGLLREIGRIEITIGNHDTSLEKLLPEDIKLHEADGFNYAGVGLAHGHKWPSSEVVENDVLVLAHNHPTITLVDELGVSHNYPCWVRGTTVEEKLIQRYGDRFKGKKTEVILIPSFLEFGSGTVVNEKDRGLLGPFLKNGLLDLMRSSVFLLDGTNLGFIDGLRIK